MMGLSYYFDAFGINYLFCYGAMFLGILFGIWLWMKPGAIWKVKKSIILMCLIFGLTLAVMLILGQYTAAGVVGFFGAGIGFAGGMYEVPLMFGDVMDCDEKLCGLRPAARGHVRRREQSDLQAGDQLRQRALPDHARLVRL